MDINLTPKGILKLNLVLIFILLVAHMFGIFSQYVYQRDLISNLTLMFNFDTELNVPTFYSSFLLFIVSMILAFIGNQQQKLALAKRPWLILSTIFLFLSLDELLVIHEGLILPIRNGFGTSGIFYFAWVIPYGIGLIVFVAVFLRFLLQLPRRTATLFIISGAVFTLGALGFELISGRYSEIYGEANLVYAGMSTVEELLEMIGVSIFIYTLLDYITTQIGTVSIHLDGPDID